MLRVAIVTSIHPNFDARIWKYATTLAWSGCEVHLVCPWNIPSDLVHGGVILHTFAGVEKRGLRPLLIPVRLFRKLLPILKGVDLVHFHDLDILPFMAVLSLFKPVIYDVHENYADEMLDRDWIPKSLRKLLYHGVYHFENLLAKIVNNLVIVVPGQREKFARLGIRFLNIVNYGGSELAKSAHPYTYLHRPDQIVFSGSQYESNGSLLLLEIASRLRNLRPDVKFLVVDRFASLRFRQRFMAERSERKLDDQVRIIPNLLPHELMILLDQGTIGISPNLRVPKQEKAIPTKLFEYMAASLPIVSSDLPYAKALLEDRGCALFAQPEDPDSFVTAIIKLVDNRLEAQKMGQTGYRVFLSSYSWESQIPELLHFYHQIIRDKAQVKTWNCLKRDGFLR